MSRAAVSIDVRTLRPVVEALIFASEEPLPPRVLVRLLAGERDDPRATAHDLDAADDGARDPGALPSTTDVETVEADGAPNEDAANADTTVYVPEETTFSEEAVVDAIELAESNAAAAGAGSLSEDVAPEWREEEIGVDGTAATQNAAELAEAYEDLNRHYAASMFPDEPVQAIDQRLVRRLVDELNTEYDESGRAFRIVEVAGGFQFATTRDFGEHVALLSKEKLRRRLSPAALETLAILAFRQPISKPEIEAIRGVNSDQVLLSLLEKNLVCITGRSETVGRPLLYGTTDDFLRIFGLNSLNDLPKLREIEELMEDNAYSAERIEVVNVSPSSDVEEIEALVGAAGHSESDAGEDDVSVERDPNAVRIDRSGDELRNANAAETEEPASIESQGEPMNDVNDPRLSDDGIDDAAIDAELESDEEPFNDDYDDDDDVDDAAADFEPSNDDLDDAAGADQMFDGGSDEITDGGLTADSEAHALEEIDTLEAGDDAFDPGDTAADRA